MSYSFEQHLDDESLELYAFGRLEEHSLETLEEHLLICEECRSRLDAAERYIKAMSRGSLLLRRKSAPGLKSRAAGWLGSFPIPAVVWTGAALAVCAIPFFSMAGYHRAPQLLAPTAAYLTTQRGPAQTVPAHHPLLLHLDARGLALAAPVHITLVDASGTQMREETAAPGESLVFRTLDPLQAGAYYIRILKPASSEPAREFALEVR